MNAIIILSEPRGRVYQIVKYYTFAYIERAKENSPPQDFFNGGSYCNRKAKTAAVELDRSHISFSKNDLWSCSHKLVGYKINDVKSIPGKLFATLY